MEKLGDSRRVAKNTVFLYLRTLITTLISLYTARVVLDVLGVEDYGVFSVVGSFVLTFNFIGSNLQVVSQRFLSYELGLGADKKVKQVFSAVLTLHVLVAFSLLLIITVAGCFYVQNVLVVEEARRDAAFYAFLFSVFSFVLNIAFTPYNAALVAYEKMSIFAYLGVLEAVLKLVICYMLWISHLDKLITYSILLFSSNLIVRLINLAYCYVKLLETRTGLSKNIKTFKEMGKFFGWNGLGSIAVMLREQGVAMLYNFFFGPAINAARSIASHIQGVAYSFVGNFGMALNPQITKLCAAGEYDKMDLMVKRGSRFSFYLMLVLSIPLCFNINAILEVWLVEVPEMTNVFTILSLVFFTLKALQTSVSAAIVATGDVKKYNLYWGGLNLLIFPLSWGLFKLGFDSSTSYYVCIIITMAVLYSMLILYKGLFGYTMGGYINSTLRPCVIVAIVSTSIAYLINMINGESLLLVLFKLILDFSITTLAIIFIGMSEEERGSILKLLFKKICHAK